MLIINVKKGGRSWNGFHSDKGVIIHAVPEPEPNEYWGSKALCGAIPGKRSYGWVKSDNIVSCEKCKKKVSELLAQIE